MGILVIFGAFVAFDLAAFRWGSDSRGLGDGHAHSEERELRRISRDAW